MNITSVRVSDAVSWIGETFAIIKDRLLLWLLPGVLFVISASVVDVVNELVQFLTKGPTVLSWIVLIVCSPLIGAYVLIITVGMMDCVRTQTESKTFSVGQVFTFEYLFGKILILQLLLMLTIAVLMLVIGLVIYLLNLQAVILFGLFTLNMTVIIPLILCVIVSIVIFSNGIPFAAALVAFDDVSPFEAFKLGLSATTRNFLSLLISFVLNLLLVFVIVFIYLIVNTILLRLGFMGRVFSVALGFSLLSLIASYMHGFVYHAYNGIFGNK